ncbi:hypothetical protein ACXIUS_25965 [Bosea thiooxidans]|nr:hypothetical protein [Bosea sp. (in: a-proteobacteria)]
MARRRSAEERLIVELIKLGFAFIGFVLTAISIAISAPFHWLSIARREQKAKFRIAQIAEENETKRKMLEANYDDIKIVDAIMSGEIWHDMTKEQLVQSWGHPEDVETKTMKTKIRQIYKYDRIGIGRFSRRATLENDRVVGWEIK